MPDDGFERCDGHHEMLDQAPSLRVLLRHSTRKDSIGLRGSDGDSRVWGSVPVPQKESPARKRGKYILEGKSRRSAPTPTADFSCLRLAPSSRSPAVGPAPEIGRR